MKILCFHKIAKIGIASLVVGCSVPTGDSTSFLHVNVQASDPRANQGEGRVGQTQQALRRPRWDEIEDVSGSCKFEADGSGPADAFVIANGQDVSLVFTRLGETNKVGPRGLREWSKCSFQLPITIPGASFISGWHQTLTYGVVKPVGVMAGLGLESSLDFAPGDRSDLSEIDVEFAREMDLNTPVATSSSFDGVAQRACDGRGDYGVTFGGTVFVWSERTQQGIPSPVVIAVDGLDARFDLGPTMAACPPLPPPPPSMCGNGIIDPNEACDTGIAEEMFGRCTEACTGCALPPGYDPIGGEDGINISLAGQDGGTVASPCVFHSNNGDSESDE